MNWKKILKDKDRTYDEDTFEEIKEVFTKLTGEDWEKVIGSGPKSKEEIEANKKLYGEFSKKSKINKLLDEYHEEYPMKWEHDLYTPHLLRWLKERLK